MTAHYAIRARDGVAQYTHGMAKWSSWPNDAPGSVSVKVRHKGAIHIPAPIITIPYDDYWHVDRQPLGYALRRLLGHGLRLSAKDSAAGSAQVAMN